MAISDIEYALLSALVNTRLDNLNEQDLLDPLSNDLGNDIRNLIASPVGTEWGVAGFEPQNITLLNVQKAASNPALTPGDLVASGMMAATFLRGNEAVIAFRGTEPALDQLLVDQVTDVYLGIGAIPPQVIAAYYYTKAAIKELTDNGVPLANISFTGHSLGGGLASIMARYFGGLAVVFDAAPNRNTALNLADGANHLSYLGASGYVSWNDIPPSSLPPSHVRLYMSEADPVSIAYGGSGGGRLGDEADISPDLHIFDLTRDTDFFATSGGTQLATKSWDTHSVHLILLQMLLDRGASGTIHANDLGNITAKLPDLMTYLTLGGERKRV